MRSTNNAPDFLSNSYLTGSPPPRRSVMPLGGPGRVAPPGGGGFDDDVEALGRIAARGDEVDVHDRGALLPLGSSRKALKLSQPRRAISAPRRRERTKMAHRLRSKVKAAEEGEALPPSSLVDCRRNPHGGELPETLE